MAMIERRPADLTFEARSGGWLSSLHTPARQFLPSRNEH
jgi:hypothetical protein